MKKRGFAVAVLFALSLVTAVSPATADDAVVTWPATTRFNPDVYDYTFHVEDTGPGVLRARWNWAPYESIVDIPKSGDVFIALPEVRDRTSPWRVLIFRCLDTCEQVASSPDLEVRTRIDIEGGIVESRPPAGSTVSAFFTSLAPHDADIRVSWKLYPAGSPSNVVAQGESVLPPGETRIPVALPSSAADGRYEFDVAAHGDFEGFGVLTGQTTNSFIIDSHLDVRFALDKPAVIYPAQDLSKPYKDVISLALVADEFMYRPSARVIDGSGDVVSNIPVRDDLAFAVKPRVIFNGKGGAELLPEGLYRVVVDVEDRSGNKGTATSPPITVEHERFSALTWKRTFKASRVVSEKLVQKCSVLANPSTHKWKGSLGFLSQTKCRDPELSVVATLNGVYIPRLHDMGWYQKLGVTMRGGSSVGAKGSYINAGLLDRKKDLIRENKTFRGGVGAYRLAGRYAQPYVRGLDDRPYILWQSGLTAGSRWDIKSWTIALTYVDFVDPASLRERHAARGGPVRATASWWRPSLASMVSFSAP